MCFYLVGDFIYIYINKIIMYIICKYIILDYIYIYSYNYIFQFVFIILNDNIQMSLYQYLIFILFIIYKIYINEYDI